MRKKYYFRLNLPWQRTACREGAQEVALESLERRSRTNPSFMNCDRVNGSSLRFRAFIDAADRAVLEGETLAFKLLL